MQLLNFQPLFTDVTDSHVQLTHQTWSITEEAVLLSSYSNNIYLFIVNIFEL